MTDARRDLPSVTALLELDAVRQALAAGRPRVAVVDAVREAIAAVRRGDSLLPSDPQEWTALVSTALSGHEQFALRRVINATGVVLHTNLGRALLSARAVRAIGAVAEDYCDLEYDTETGARGSRHGHCVELLQRLTGADDALVVNNCAAAVMLSLCALAGGRSVAISRGELVEIGGSFRIPEVMQLAGVQLTEIGTTNRTHLRDYERALESGVAAVVKVHRSNFVIDGFTAEVSVRDLAPLCAEYGVPLIHDFGSGLMVSLEEYGLAGEPTAREVVQSGATLMAMSGDKLLGGPQAGILLGDRAAIAKLRSDPLARAVRIDKLGIAALAATLQAYRDSADALRSIPTLVMLTASPEQLEERAAAVADRLSHARLAATVTACDGAVGAGAFPTTAIPSFGVALAGDPEALASRLRGGSLPVVGRIRGGALLLNLRSVPERDDDLLGDCIAAALA